MLVAFLCFVARLPLCRREQLTEPNPARGCIVFSASWTSSGVSSRLLSYVCGVGGLLMWAVRARMSRTVHLCPSTALEVHRVCLCTCVSSFIVHARSTAVNPQRFIGCLVVCSGQAVPVLAAEMGAPVQSLSLEGVMTTAVETGMLTDGKLDFVMVTVPSTNTVEVRAKLHSLACYVSCWLETIGTSPYFSAPCGIHRSLYSIRTWACGYFLWAIRSYVMSRLC